MVRTADELLQDAKQILGDNKSDSAIQFLENITDSLKTDGEDWKKKYQDNDAEWRKKYTDRFFSGNPQPEPPKETPPKPPEKPKSETIKIEDLFVPYQKEKEDET